MWRSGGACKGGQKCRDCHRSRRGLPAAAIDVLCEPPDLHHATWLIINEPRLPPASFREGGVLEGHLKVISPQVGFEQLEWQRAHSVHALVRGGFGMSRKESVTWDQTSHKGVPSSLYNVVWSHKVRPKCFYCISRLIFCHLGSFRIASSARSSDVSSYRISYPHSLCSILASSLVNINICYI